MMLKGTINQDISFQTVYATKNRTSTYTEQKLVRLKREIDKATISVDNLNIPLSIIDFLKGKKLEKLNTIN